MDSLIAHDIFSGPRTEDVCLLDNVCFRDMFFSEPIYKALTENGFHKPSPIQYKAIPLARCGFDLIVKSKSGTGKTLVFVTTALESVDPSIKRVQAIVLTPTREIALQATEVFKIISSHIKDLQVESFIGGTPLPKDIASCEKCHIAIGAPGRICQLINLGHLKTDAVRLFVLDEADQLMAKTFQTEINFIYWSLSEFKQMLALSATYPQELVEFLGNYMRNGKLITPETDPAPMLKGLKQFVSLTRDHPDSLARLTDKENRLVSLLSMVKFNQCLIFSNYKSRAESTCNMLRCRGWTCEWISGGQAQEQRIKALTELRLNRCRLLVTTDLTARGIDSKGINLVINMDTPYDPRIYLHRMGRAGRYGSQGVVITILSRGCDLDNFLQMLGLIDKALTVKVIPTGTSFDLWSDESLNFDELQAAEFTSESLERYKREFACTEATKSDSNKNKKIKTAVSKQGDVGCDSKKNITPPDLNEKNFPSITNKKMSLNDYFLNESETGEFLSLSSLKNLLEEFKIPTDLKEETVGASPTVNGIKENNQETISVLKRNGSTEGETKKKPNTVLEEKTVGIVNGNKEEVNPLKKQFVVKSMKVNEKELSKKVLANATRRFSYSDIAKGKRVECKPVDLKPEEIVILKKSPLKLFPTEKVSNEIEGVCISDKAIDGFSKRMYSSVLKGSKVKCNLHDQKHSTESSFKGSNSERSSSEKSEVQPRRNQSNVKKSFSFNVTKDQTKITSECIDLARCQSSRSSSLNSDENVQIQSSKLINVIKPDDANSKMPLNGTNHSECFDIPNSSEQITTTVPNNVELIQKRSIKIENVLKVNGVCNSNNPEEIKNSSNVDETHLNLNKAQDVSSPRNTTDCINQSLSVNGNSFYEKQAADLSRISCRRRPSRNKPSEVRVEDSSSTYSSDSEGEYFVTGPFTSNFSFTRLQRSSENKSESKPFDYNQWFKMYQHQKSMIYNYVKFSKKCHYDQSFYN